MKAFLKHIIVALLTLEAKLVLAKYTPRVVVITGSVGKTSTKDAVAEVLSRQFFIRKSEKSYNSETGVPLTILGCKNPWNNYTKWLQVLWEGLLLVLLPNHYPKILVLEVGADKPGDVRSMMRWITPDVVIVTKLPDIPVHVEAYASPGETRDEEFSPACALPPEGTLIYNADDAYAADLAGGVSAAVRTFGYAAEADTRIEKSWVCYEQGKVHGLHLNLLHDNETHKLIVADTVGEHQAYPIGAALEAGKVFGISREEMNSALERYIPPAGRMRIIEGRSGATIIDDSYNASPVAVRAALETLQDIETQGKRIAVLGDMLELGTFSMDEHRKAGACAVGAADMLVTVGVRAYGIAEGAKEAGMPDERIHSFDTAEDAGVWLRTQVGEGDLVLVKGSQGVRTERVVERLIKDPSLCEKVLVRQDREWKQR